MDLHQLDWDVDVPLEKNDHDGGSLPLRFTGAKANPNPLPFRIIAGSTTTTSTTAPEADAEPEGPSLSPIFRKIVPVPLTE
mmetsp:Transcript_14071/g.34872  ORF Transcript_14071/g.34872 Transcript_14071/m.34872 type:complete len:81 (+) Transcript_14071:74-316(+)